jgi:hypothetical protein
MSGELLEGWGINFYFKIFNKKVRWGFIGGWAIIGAFRVIHQKQLLNV